MPSHSDSDADLLLRLRGGDREAFAVLVARHYGLVVTSCRRQSAPGEEDDCAQAVFLILERKPAAAIRATALEAWLLRVAWYVCRNSRRVAQRRRQAERAAATAAHLPSALPEALDHLDDCLVALPERQRAAIALHFLSGRTAEEIAAHLGTSRDNAYQLISRGLGALRELLARRGVVMAGVGLASVLAAEAQAAVAPAPVVVLAGLSAPPSVAVASLSTGAMKAMTIAALAPFTAAASLALAVGTTAALLAAEPAPLPAPVPAPVVSSMPAEVARDPVQKADSLHGQWSALDSRFVAPGLAQKILADPWLAQFATDKQRLPKLVFGKFVVRLENAAAVQMQPLIDVVERDLLASNKVQVLAIPIEERRAIQENQGPTVPAATASPMDVVVAGTLTSAADQEGNSKVVFYTVTLKGIDPATQQVLFSVEERIRKEIEQSRWK